MKDLDCSQFFSVVSEYYDENLPEEQRALFDKHFNDCGMCRKFFEGFRDTMKVVDGPVKDQYKTMEIPADVQKRIVEYILEKNKPTCD